MEAKKKKYDFWVAGMVHPREYNWKKQVLQTKKDTTGNLFIKLDRGKFFGLMQYILELEKGRD